MKSRSRSKRAPAPLVQASSGPWSWGALALIVGAAAAIRVMAAWGELWLDEIWSVDLAHEIAGRPLAVFTSLHHDNNNHLNTLFLTLIPWTSHWVLYRLHVIATGVGTVVLGALIARRAGSRAGLVAALLMGGSYWLILYASEARGYALAVFFALLCVPLAERYFASGRTAWAIAFGVSGACGMLSHLVFLHAYLGLVVWTAVASWRRGAWSLRLTAIATLHMLPIAALATLYWIDLRHVGQGGAVATPATAVILRALSLTMGGPESGVVAVVVAAAAIVLCLASIHAVWRSGSDLWTLFAVTTVVAPVLTVVVAAAGGRPLFERYFVVAIAFTLLAAAWWIASMARRSIMAAVLVVGAVLAGNSLLIVRLVELGRGSYVAALSHMLSHSKRAPVTLSSDHDFRHTLALDFYQRFVPRGYELSYQPAPNWPAPGPEWILVHDQRRDFVPQPGFATREGYEYVLADFRLYAGTSGWHLAVYHNRIDAQR
jgi:hypothetical protein